MRGRQELIDLALHPQTRFDLLWQLLYDGILENLFQLVLGITYSNTVAGVGLDSIAQWSVAFSIVGLVKLVLHAAYNVVTLRAVVDLGRRASTLIQNATRQSQTTPVQPIAAGAAANADEA